VNGAFAGSGSDTPNSQRTARAGLQLFVALALIALLLWGFAVLADEFSDQAWLARLDLSVLNWLQRHGSEQGENVFVFVSWLGAPILFAVDVAFAIVLAVRREWRSFTIWTIAILGGVALDEVLKLAFRRARPDVASEFISSHSWSFPSGHAMNSLVTYAMLAYLLRGYVAGARARIAIAMGAAVLVTAIGFSRLYLGVHYLSDVTAGYLAGGAWVLACITTARYAFARPHSHSSAPFPPQSSRA
jgi:membrane-associated phospholipid phosphatase